MEISRSTCTCLQRQHVRIYVSADRLGLEEGVTCVQRPETMQTDPTAPGTLKNKQDHYS